MANPQNDKGGCLPPEGWSGPDKDGQLRYVKHNALHAEPPKREGYECYWVGVHGAAWTRWVYRPVES